MACEPMRKKSTSRVMRPAARSVFSSSFFRMMLPFHQAVCLDITDDGLNVRLACSADQKSHPNGGGPIFLGDAHGLFCTVRLRNTED